MGSFMIVGEEDVKFLKTIKEEKLEQDLGLEFMRRVKEKPTLNIGQVYEMFGGYYKACAGSNCDDCAFCDCRCDLNVDIPSCNNDIHFEKVEKKKFLVNYKAIVENKCEVEAFDEKEAKRIIENKIKNCAYSSMNILSSNTEIQ